MPFLLRKDTVLTEETATNDYEKWLNDDYDPEQRGNEGGSSRNELMKVPQQESRRFENCG